MVRVRKETLLDYLPPSSRIHDTSVGFLTLRLELGESSFGSKISDCHLEEKSYIYRVKGGEI